jgi:hypothetical protein
MPLVGAHLEAMGTIEALRASYRPHQITTLFVGESAPRSGKFFYDGDNSMVRYMQRATEAVISGTGDFLDRFKSYGWYLDDLVLTPVNKMTNAQRKAEWIGAQDSLRDRIADYRPLAIVSLLVGIKGIVHSAAIAAGCKVELFAVPFPGMGQQGRFHDAMVKLIPLLPKQVRNPHMLHNPISGKSMPSDQQTQVKSKEEKRPAHRTQWAAQFAVASELCKRGYEVAFTMGNATPLADLMVVSPASKRNFLIDVKGLYKPNPWVIKEKPTRDALFYILAFVPDDASNRFFILSQEQVNTYIRTELTRLGRPDDYPMTGILWKQAADHENKWDILPK